MVASFPQTSEERTVKKTTSTRTAPRSTRDQELRRLLEQRRREIDLSVREQLSEAREARATPEPSGPGEDGELDDTEAREAVEFGLLRVKRELRRRIDEALDRLETGEYGTCVECGEEIPTARLNALPFAVRCLECQELHEAVAHDRRAPTRAALSVFLSRAE